MQRPLWASTSTKNPAYPDTLYVDTLIGAAHRQHDARDARSTRRATTATRRTRSTRRSTPPPSTWRSCERLGVDLDRILLRELVDEGVESFTKSFDSLITTIADKARELAPARA